MVCKNLHKSPAVSLL